MRKYPTSAGIYKLTCVINGKIYIGKASVLSTRLSGHKTAKGGGSLQNAIIKYGWDSFTVEILEIFDSFDKEKDNILLLEKEAHYIELFDSTNRDKGYNICKFSNDSTGFKWTEEMKSKIRGRTHSEETKEKMRQASLGKSHSDESKEKIRNSRLGMKFSDETKEKMKSRRHSDETKEKIKISKLGTKISEETKEKMSKAKLGKSKSDETKEKMRQANLGKVLSEETKNKIKETKALQRNAKNEESKV